MKAHTISKLLFVKLLSLNNNSNSFQKKNREKTNTIQKPRKLVKKSERFDKVKNTAIAQTNKKKNNV